MESQSDVGNAEQDSWPGLKLPGQSFKVLECFGLTGTNKNLKSRSRYTVAKRPWPLACTQVAGYFFLQPAVLNSLSLLPSFAVRSKY